MRLFVVVHFLADVFESGERLDAADAEMFGNRFCRSVVTNVLMITAFLRLAP